MAKKDHKSDLTREPEDPKKKKQEKELAHKKARRWRRRAVFAILALIFVFISLYWTPAEMDYRVREVYRISSPEAADLHLAVLLPVTGPSQTVSDPEVTWPGNWEVETIGRMTLLRLEGQIPAGETFTAEITYRVDLAQGETAWTGEPVVSHDLLPEDGVPSADPEWQAQAGALLVAGDPAATARRIYDQVAAQSAGLDSADAAYRLATLNRAAQIPTRVVTGWVFPDSVPLIKSPIAGDAFTAYRNWNETFLQESWQMVDASARQVFVKPRLLGWTDGRHLALAEIADLNALSQSLVAEAGDASWQTDPALTAKVVGWSESGAEDLDFTARITVQKLWDGRWALAIALGVILLILDWMVETDHYSKKAKGRAVAYES